MKMSLFFPIYVSAITFLISESPVMISSFLLQNAAQLKIYDPEDYKKKPKKYCGMEISDNPYYDI